MFIFFVVLKLFSKFPTRISAAFTNQGKKKSQALILFQKFGIKVQIKYVQNMCQSPVCSIFSIVHLKDLLK